MRAISLWQPWSSACVTLTPWGVAIKGIETRHWSTNYRGPLAIHAAKRWDADQRQFWLSEWNMPANELMPFCLPLGMIVGTVDLIDVIPTELLLDSGLDPRERDWGNYGPGRFGWLFHNPRRLSKPIPWRGGRSFFSVPDEIVNAAI